VEQLESKALEKKKAEAPPKQSAVQVAETLKTVGSVDEAKTLLQGRTKAELLEISKATEAFRRNPRQGQGSGTKSKIIDQIVAETVGGRLSFEVLTRGGMRGDTATGSGQSPTQVAEALKTIGSRDEAAALLQDKTKTELQEIMKAAGFEPGPGSRGSRGTKPNLIADIVEGTVGSRLSREALESMPIQLSGSAPKKSAGPSRADLEGAPLSELVALEEELGIQRTSLDRQDRINAILAKLAG
jgi:hypothetical protein